MLLKEGHPDMTGKSSRGPCGQDWGRGAGVASWTPRMRMWPVCAHVCIVHVGMHVYPGTQSVYTVYCCSSVCWKKQGHGSSGEHLVITSWSLLSALWGPRLFGEMYEPSTGPGSVKGLNHLTTERKAVPKNDGAHYR